MQMYQELDEAATELGCHGTLECRHEHTTI